MKTPVILGAGLLLAGCGIPEAMATSAQADRASRIARANSDAQIANAQSAEQIAHHYATLASNAMWASLLPGILLLIAIAIVVCLAIWSAVILAKHYMEKKDQQHRRELAARLHSFELELAMRERMQIGTEQTYHNRLQLAQHSTQTPAEIVIKQRPRHYQ